MTEKPVTLTLSVAQLAELGQTSEITIYRHVRKGALKAIKQGTRALRISYEEAERYLGVPITPGKQF